MGATETVETTDVTPWDPDEPLMAHIARWRLYGYEDGNETVALCGARILGIPAPPGHEPKCGSCQRILMEYIGL